MNKSPSHYRLWLKYTSGAVALATAGVALHMQGCFAAVASFFGLKGVTLYASTVSAKLASGGIFLWGSLGGTFFLVASVVAWTYYLSKAISQGMTQASASQRKEDIQDKVDAKNPKSSAKNLDNHKPNNKSGVINNINGSDKEKYNQKIQNTSKHVKEIEEDLILCKGIIKTLDSLVEKAQHAHFESNGKLSTTDQPPRNKLQILLWKEKNLQKIVATPQRNERAALKRSIEQKADRKLSTCSKKGFRL